MLICALRGLMPAPLDATLIRLLPPFYAMPIHTLRLMMFRYACRRAPLPPCRCAARFRCCAIDVTYAAAMPLHYCFFHDAAMPRHAVYYAAVYFFDIAAMLMLR